MPDDVATFRFVTLARLPSTKAVPWWTLAVTPDRLVVRRRFLRTEHAFDRQATLMMPARATLRGRVLTVRRTDQLDWFLRVALPSSLADALRQAGWAVDDR